MANTFPQLHIQFVFAVQYREALIHSAWKNACINITSNQKAQNARLPGEARINDNQFTESLFAW
jgi:hypothetical protein